MFICTFVVEEAPKVMAKTVDTAPRRLVRRTSKHALPSSSSVDQPSEKKAKIEPFDVSLLADSFSFVCCSSSARYV